MAEDPFSETELPDVNHEDSGAQLKKNELRESKISIAISNASGLAMEISKNRCMNKEDAIVENKDSDMSPCDEVDTIQEVSLLLDEEEQEKQSQEA